MDSKAKSFMQLRGRKGMSLIEMLIATSVLALLLATLFPALTMFSRVYAKTNYEADFQRSSSLCLEMLSMDARMAKSFTVASKGMGLTINMPDGSAVTYTVKGSKSPFTLERTSGGDSMVVLNDIHTLSFSTTDSDATIVGLEAILRRKVSGGQYAEKVLDSQFRKRL